MRITISEREQNSDEADFCSDDGLQLARSTARHAAIQYTNPKFLISSVHVPNENRDENVWLDEFSQLQRRYVAALTKDDDRVWRRFSKCQPGRSGFRRNITLFTGWPNGCVPKFRIAYTGWNPTLTFLTARHYCSILSVNKLLERIHRNTVSSIP